MVDASIQSTKKKDDTVDKVEESRDTSVSNRPNEITKSEKLIKPPEIIIPKDNLDISVLSVLGSSLSSVTPDQKIIPLKNKRKETPAVSIIRKEPIQETVNPRKISQGYSLMHPEKEIRHKMSQPFRQIEDCEGNTDENKCNADDSLSDN